MYDFRLKNQKNAFNLQDLHHLFNLRDYCFVTNKFLKYLQNYIQDTYFGLEQFFVTFRLSENWSFLVSWTVGVSWILMSAQHGQKGPVWL